MILYEDRHRQFLLALTRAPLLALPQAPLSVPTEPHFILTKGQGAVVAKEQWLRLQLAYCHLAELRVTVHKRDSSSVNNGKIHLHRRKCSPCLLYYSSLSFILTKGRGAAAAEERRRRLLHCSFGRIRSHLRAEVKKTPTTKVSFVYLIFQI